MHDETTGLVSLTVLQQNKIWIQIHGYLKSSKENEEAATHTISTLTSKLKQERVPMEHTNESAYHFESNNII